MIFVEGVGECWQALWKQTEVERLELPMGNEEESTYRQLPLGIGLDTSPLQVMVECPAHKQVAQEVVGTEREGQVLSWTELQCLLAMWQP